MEKLIEIDGRWIYVSSKVIEINGDPVITQGDIKILNQYDQITTQKNMHATNEFNEDVISRAT